MSEPEKEPEEKPKESEESIQKRALEARAQFKQKGGVDNLIIFMVLHSLMIKIRCILIWVTQDQSWNYFVLCRIHSTAKATAAKVRSEHFVQRFSLHKEIKMLSFT